MKLITEHVNPTTPKIQVLAEKMAENKINHAILIVRQPLTPFAKSAMQETAAKMTKLIYMKK